MAPSPVCRNFTKTEEAAIRWKAMGNVERMIMARQEVGKKELEREIEDISTIGGATMALREFTAFLAGKHREIHNPEPRSEKFIAELKAFRELTGTPHEEGKSIERDAAAWQALQDIESMIRDGGKANMKTLAAQMDLISFDPGNIAAAKENFVNFIDRYYQETQSIRHQL